MMMNQRAGKYHKATGMDDGQSMRMYQFFKSCRRQLEEEGHEDAAFYFEQVEEHLKNGKGLPALDKDVANVLGL